MNLDINNPPEKITLEINLMLSEYGYLIVNDGLMDSYTEIASPVEVTFKLKKREEINNELVARLKDEAKDIRAEAEIKCKNIDEKIQSLLALPQTLATD